MTDFPSLRRRCIAVADRLGGWPRRIAALVLLLAAGISALARSPGAATQPTTASRSVLVAAHDLPAGRAVTAGDLRAVRLPGPTLPAGAVYPGTDLAHRRLAGPVRRGEVLTDVRFVESALTTGLANSAPGGVAVPVRLADAATAALLHPGDRVDVLAGVAPGGDTAPTAPVRVLARDVVVLMVPASGTDATADGALVVLGAAPDTAGRLAVAATSAPLTVTLRAT